MNATPTRRVLLAGATGLVGGHLLQQLLGDQGVSEVHVVGRRAPAIRHPMLKVHVVDFRRLPALPAVDEVYLALGTTIRQAGSQAAFRAIDLEANLAVARAAAGARRVGLVSAAGADARSTVFYSRVKGELEQALAELNLDTLVIARPSLLLGDRDGLGQPPRLGERLAMPLARLMAPVLPGAWRPVQARDVARALAVTTPRARGTVLLSSSELIRAAAGH
ncbi:MAG: hypothetical protein PWQ61_1242 [Betaproteobacteria bacterium]|nr:hypothetical protein [Betaproteobacteria bacterium]